MSRETLEVLCARGLVEGADVEMLTACCVQALGAASSVLAAHLAARLGDDPARWALFVELVDGAEVSDAEVFDTIDVALSPAAGARRD